MTLYHVSASRQARGAGRHHVLTTLQRTTTRIKQSTGLIILLVGLWTLALALWADTFAF